MMIDSDVSPVACSGVARVRHGVRRDHFPMFAWWGRAVVRWRWAVLAAGLVVVLVGGLWGLGVFGQLTGGGFEDPASESTKARERVTAEIGDQDVDILVLYTSPDATVDQ